MRLFVLSIVLAAKVAADERNFHNEIRKPTITIGDPGEMPVLPMQPIVLSDKIRRILALLYPCTAPPERETLSKHIKRVLGVTQPERRCEPAHARVARPTSK